MLITSLLHHINPYPIIYEPIYYPTQKKNEIPHCDEFVVFHKSQTLPRFWIELEVELPYISFRYTTIC